MVLGFCIGGPFIWNLLERAGEGNPDDVAAKVRAEGGIADSQMVRITSYNVCYTKLLRAT